MIDIGVATTQMRFFLFIRRCALCFAIIAATGCKPRAQTEAAPPAGAQQTPVAAASAAAPTATETPTPAPEKSRVEKLADKVRPAVVLVTVFDPTGKLLRSGTGFFVSESGRIITTVRTIDGAVNAVAKASDGEIYNITSVLTSSSKLGVAILNADVKSVPALPLSEKALSETGTQAAVIGSALAGNDGKPLEATVAKNGGEQSSNELTLAATVPEASHGAPVVDDEGQVIGVVTERSKKEETSMIVRPASVLKSLAGEIQPNSVVKWPGEARPTPTPKPRLVYTPKPVYPSDARFSDGTARTGRYKIIFNGDGTAKTVQILNSTGVESLDSSAVKGLGQWKCEAGRDGAYIIVPLTFQSR